MANFIRFHLEFNSEDEIKKTICIYGKFDGATHRQPQKSRQIKLIFQPNTIKYRKRARAIPPKWIHHSILFNRSYSERIFLTRSICSELIAFNWLVHECYIYVHFVYNPIYWLKCATNAKRDRYPEQHSGLRWLVSTET